MKRLLVGLLLFLTFKAAALDHTQVVVLYNSNEAESREVALDYARGRGIPSTQLVGLDVPMTDTISRDVYNEKVRAVLERKFATNGWWQAPSTTQGNQPIALRETKMKALVCIRGVPFRISRSKDRVAPPEAVKQFKGVTEASVDGDLACLATWNSSLTGPVPNPYFKKDTLFNQKQIPWGMLLVTRIDGPSYEICRRMIKDVLEVEKTGLWGRGYIDLAEKYKQGDDWLKNITKQCDQEGIPCIVEPTKDTFTSHYPMTDAALYFGWYRYNRDGALLSRSFKFRKGAVAVHIHSFSAEKLRSNSERWCGPLLAKGAAASLGNVYEPYLGITHHLDIFFDRLLKGYTLAEAAYMAQPAVSWHNLVLGDPLYRPFKHFKEADGEVQNGDKVFRAYRLAHMEWQNDPVLRTSKIRTAASRMNSGTLYEAIGAQLLRQKQYEQAAAFFESAKNSFILVPDKLRQDINLIDVLRRLGKKQQALADTEAAIKNYKEVPEAKALIGIRNILRPPAPKPKSQPKK